MNPWIHIELRYADPTHAPEWALEDRPAWEAGGVQKAAFRDWVSERLDELRTLVRAERLKELKPLDRAELLKDVSRQLAEAGARRSAMRLAHPGLTEEQLDRKMLRLAEERESGQRRRGPTKGAGEPPPAARAAWDMWRIRKVIFPRFWPEEHGRRDHLDVARIAASRHPGATPEATDSWYENNRLAKC